MTVSQARCISVQALLTAKGEGSQKLTNDPEIPDGKVWQIVVGAGPAIVGCLSASTHQLADETDLSERDCLLTWITEESRLCCCCYSVAKPCLTLATP